MVGDPCIGQHSGHAYPCTNGKGLFITDADKRLSPSLPFPFSHLFQILILHPPNTHTRTHARTHARTHTRTHTHTHTGPYCPHSHHPSPCSQQSQTHNLSSPPSLSAFPPMYLPHLHICYNTVAETLTTQCLMFANLQFAPAHNRWFDSVI